MKDNKAYQTSCSNWVEVDLSAIQGNIRFYLEHTHVQVMAVVKANAYGHGAVPVAKAALSAGATWCGVARVEEALELRQAGIESPTLLLGYTPPDRYDEMIAKRVSITVWDQDQVNQAAQAAKRVGETARLHLKIDSGMSRLGVQAEDANQLASYLASTPGVSFEGMFTHFAVADEANPEPTDLQEKRFRWRGRSPRFCRAATRLVTRGQLSRRSVSPECVFQPRPSWHRHLWPSGVLRLGFARGISTGASVENGTQPCENFTARARRKLRSYLYDPGG